MVRIRRRAAVPRSLVRLAAAATVLLLAGCERGSAPRAADSAAVPPAATPADSVATSASAWDPSFGAGLLVPAESPNVALGVSPDTETLGLDAGTPVILMTRSGAVERSAIGSAADEADGCEGLPAWKLSGPTNHPWSVGFVNGQVQPLALDSIGALSRGDSSRLAAAATRMASALPGSGFERFVGLPFVPESMWRMRLPADRAGATDVVAAILVRRLNLEAQPLQERTFLVFEQRPGGDPSLVHSERSQGSEEHIETRDVLGAVRMGAGGDVTLVVSHDYGDAIAYALLQRDSSGTWRVRWMSHRANC